MFQDEDYSLSELLDPDSEPTILRAHDVAVLLGCGPDAARTLIKSEGFPITYVGTRNYIEMKTERFTLHHTQKRIWLNAALLLRHDGFIPECSTACCDTRSRTKRLLPAARPRLMIWQKGPRASWEF